MERECMADVCRALAQIADKKTRFRKKPKGYRVDSTWLRRVAGLLDESQTVEEVE